MVWSLEDGKERARLSGHGTDVVAVDFSPDGKILATAGKGGVVKLWDSTTFQIINSPSGRDTGVDLVGFAPDSKTLVGANAQGLVTLWDVPSGKARATFTHSGGMNMVVVSHDGKTLATGGGKIGSKADTSGGLGEIRLWEVTTGRQLAVLSVTTGRITRLAFAPDDKTLAAATETASIMVWDLTTKSPRATLSWQSGPALFLTFSPDSKTLASGGEDNLLRLWDASTGNLRASLRGHVDAIDWIMFSPDGRTIFTASRDATTKLWDVPAGAN
jgi:WD40 repeat protein